MHGNLRTLVGAADYALYVKDPVLYSRVDALYRYVRSEGTRFGFLPEVIGRKGDIVSCETCALMDFLGLAVSLANNGHPEYWGDVERMVRNQLLESQVRDVSWLKPGNQADTEQFTWRDVGARMVGGYSGWTSPTHILAAARIFTGAVPSCGARPAQSRTAAADRERTLSSSCGRMRPASNRRRCPSHLHIDKLLPQAEIRCYQPYQGLLTIELKTACQVRVRIPDFVEPAQIQASSSQGEVKPGCGATTWSWAAAGRRESGSHLSLAVRGRGSHHRQSRLSAVSLSGDLEGRYRGADGAQSATGHDRVLGF